MSSKLMTEWHLRSASDTLEEDIVLIEDNNSWTSLSQDFPRGQDMEEEDGVAEDPDRHQPEANVCACVLCLNNTYRKWKNI